MSRGRLLASAAAAAGALALGTAATPAVAATNKGGQWSFSSAPGLHPPSLAVTTNSLGSSGGYMFTAPIYASGRPGHFTGQHGALMTDPHGSPVWFAPSPRGQVAMTLRPANYLGTPVLVYFQGTITSLGQGSGEWIVLNRQYKRIATIHATSGYATDFHEFMFDPHEPGAFIVAERNVRANLTRWHGPSNGQILDTVVQEINVKTGKLMFQWDPLHQVSLDEPYQGPSSSGWDAFHLNSIDFDRQGNLLLSMRNTWALYDINRRTSKISWRLGGKRSNFKLEPGVRFAWQHDGRFAGTNMISLFDDESWPAEGKQSRGELVRLDTVHRAAHLAQQWTHSPSVLTGSQGNAEFLSNGNVFVGWGQYPYLSEYDSSGNVLFDAHFHGPDESYRAYAGSWTGTPTTNPSIAGSKSDSGTTLYASWNGATEVASWRVLSGPTSSTLVPSGDADRSGFETTISTGASGPYFAVEALDSSGRVLGTSKTINP